VNTRIRTVFDGLALLFGALLVMLTWWQVFEAGSLRERDYNQQNAYYEQRIERGTIRTSDGTILATSRPSKTAQGDTIYLRRYPQGKLFAHVVGYSTTGRSRTGIERAMNDDLTGANAELANTIDRLRGDDVVRGSDLTLTLNARAQRVAMEQLAGRRGSVVALDPKTGAVRVLLSSPSYDPAKVEGDAYSALLQRKDSPLLDRATQAHYAPGSTFKLVTASAGLETGTVTPETQFPGRCEFKTSGPPIKNFGGACVGGHDLTKALTLSINTTFADLGQQLGASVLLEQMKQFGFGSTPALDDLPGQELQPSGVSIDSKTLLPSAQPRNDNIDVARVAIGQERLSVTPLQMALVVAAIANGGEMQQPYLVQRIRNRAGHITTIRPDAHPKRAISAKTAAELTEMMQNVVREGSGTAAALEGIDVAGKTGTADTPTGNQVWFVGFAPADNPTIAIAVTLEAQPSGATGGVVAGPIAKAVMQALLGTPTNRTLETENSG
jgi:peptidoglycan glycosyltransferase